MDPWTREQSDKIERRVVSMEWEGKTARAVIAQRFYPTEIEDLWNAIVDPERLQRWFLPISGDLREGGIYQLEGNAGGKINRCEAPRHLALTWEMHGGIGWVNVKLEESGEEATQLTLEHIAHDDAALLEFWGQYGPGAVGVGWDLGLFGLAGHLKSGGDGLPMDEEAWMKTEDGRGFAHSSSEGWVAAAIAFGTDKRDARAAGERTTAFYTGESTS